MKILPDFNKILSLGVSLVFLSTAANLTAATWGGGNGNWVSDNWGLDAPNGSPGDANYPNEAATLNSVGTLVIGTGDIININANTFMSVSEVNQTGGSYTNSNRVDNRTNFTVNSGTFTTTSSTWVSSGGAYNFKGGTVSTGAIEYVSGAGAVNISGGNVTMAQIRMDKATNGIGSVTVTGSTISHLQSTTLVFANIVGGVSNSSNVNFVFDGSGVAAWNIIGGAGSLNLGAGLTAANLSVNVSAMLSDGVTGVNLFDYGNAATVNGAFNTVTITDTTYGTLALGTEGALNPGEYFLDYGGTGDTDVTLFYNTIPEPGTLVLVGLGLAVLPFRRRHHGKS